MRLATFVLATVVGLTATATAQRKPPSAIYDVGNGVTSPVTIKEVLPTYTQAALRAKVQGSVFLNAVVLDDGSVSQVEVAKSLDPELDQQAIDALEQWEFKPGTREGKPVAVRITCELTFTLK